MSHVGKQALLIVGERSFVIEEERYNMMSQDSIALWKELMVDHKGTIPERMKDDQVEEAFWASMLNKNQCKIAPYAQVVQKEILSLLNRDDRVLEIGPGWGNYTFAIGDKVQELTCVDSSESILRFLEVQAAEKSIQNIKLEHGKWEERDILQKYDVVFGFNCYYRMYDIGAALQKMNNCANRLAIAGMTTGPEKPHYLELQRMGYQINMRRRDYIHILNVLYQLGIIANCKIIKLESKKSYSSYDKLIQDNTTKILDTQYNLYEVESILDKYVIEREGIYEYTYPFHAALIYWSPERQD